jgi:hypothetical protein
MQPNRSRFIEDDEQKDLFQWASVKANSGCMTRLMFAVPNGGKRNPREGARMKLQGTKAGVPDIFLPVPRNGFHGLWIELKRPIVKGEAKPVVSPEQKYWIEQLREQGYRAEVCYGWIEAKTLIEEYLK